MKWCLNTINRQGFDKVFRGVFVLTKQIISLDITNKIKVILNFSIEFSNIF